MVSDSRGGVGASAPLVALLAAPPPAVSAPVHSVRIPPNLPNLDGRAEKRFSSAPVRGWPRRAFARVFGGFAPRADSGLREAGQADAAGGVWGLIKHVRFSGRRTAIFF